MWRFWRALPPKGKIGIFFGSWYTDPIVERVHRATLKRAELEQQHRADPPLRADARDEGALLLKFWFHLSKTRRRSASRSSSARQADRLARDRARLGALQALRPLPRGLRATRCARPAPARRRGSSSRARTRTTGRSPSGKLLLDALRQRLDEPAPKRSRRQAPAPPAAPIDRRERAQHASTTRRRSSRRRRYENEHARSCRGA